MEINDRLYVELVNEELGSGVEGKGRVNGKGSRAEGGDRGFYELVARKVERLLMDKELGRVEVVVVEGGFAGGNATRYNNISNGNGNSGHNSN